MLEDQASRTAERVAQRRAAHQILDDPPVFRDPLALRVIAPAAAAALRANPRDAESSPLGRYLRAFLAVRSRFAEEEVAEAVGRGVSQYVIVGAGFDTFAYRNPFPDLAVFEVDHPATQSAKRRRLEEAGIEAPAHVHFIAADLAVRPLGEALAANGFDPASPATFAWLGVVPYLELDAIDATLRYVASLPVGTEIIFDYGVPRASLGFLGRIAFDRMANRVAAAGEPWKTFFDPADLRRRLLDLGFSSIDDLGGPELNARYFAGRADGLRVGEAGHIAKAAV